MSWIYGHHRQTHQILCCVDLGISSRRSSQLLFSHQQTMSEVEDQARNSQKIATLHYKLPGMVVVWECLSGSGLVYMAYCG